ncbi:GNAT family N-acetyltransferase [Micromonospora sp. WMMD882]|uniref:GNAT family N-acetyltransferase n=1 Tax=Micromonospora sp. WMMD882 TaxID=3015151 RepID=UPI00248C27ED|nr:GNAT family N-acetyltransferase [Micromonospora sp. WMMD882]WBB81852.1 GNAT family N-acetyltransferase [Micromonospora sp. WMMD882]
MRAIRREEPDDAEAVARVHVRGWQAGYAGIMPAEVLGRLNVAAWAQRRRDTGAADPANPFTTLVAEVDGTVAGFATFGPYRVNQSRAELDETCGEVVGLYVDPTRWGDGTAGALFAAARAGLAGRGWTAYRVWVLAANTRARRFYTRAGLSPDGEESTYPVPMAGGRPPLPLAELRYAGPLGSAG